MKHAPWAAVLLGTLLATGASVGADQDPEAAFQELWEQFDLRYALFEVKSIDWDALYQIYRPRVTPETTPDELFTILSEMLGHLNDNHVILISDELQRSSSGGYLDRYISELGFSGALEMLAQRPLADTAFHRPPRTSAHGIFQYGWVAEDVGYLHIPGFNNQRATAEDLDQVLAEFAQARALMVDVRYNQGGDDRVGKLIADRFADERRLYMVTRDRIGAGHGDYAPPRYWHVEPRGDQRFTGPIILLQDRSTISAGENFALAMRVLPHVTIVGDFTSGCFADMAWGELTNGFRYSLSRNRFDDYAGRCWEGIGVPPDIMVRGGLLEGGGERAFATARALLAAGAPARQDEAASADAARTCLSERLVRDAETVGPESAAERFMTAQRELPPDAWYIDCQQIEALGTQLMRAGDMGTALVLYDLYAQSFPAYFRTHFLLGTACWRAGESARGREAYARARQLTEGEHPLEVGALVQMEVRECVYMDGPKALPACFRALRTAHPDHMGPELLNELGYELINAQRIDDAVALFRLNVDEFPDYANGYDSLGEGFALLGKTDLAIENYERALALNPDNRNAEQMLERLRAD